MRPAVERLWIGIALAAAAYVVVRTKGDPDASRAPVQVEDDAGPSSDAGPAARPPSRADPVVGTTPGSVPEAPPPPPPVPRSPVTAPAPVSSSAPAASAASTLARPPNGRASPAPVRPPPGTDDGGPARPRPPAPSLAAGLPFADPAEPPVAAFVPEGTPPRDPRTLVGRVLRPDKTPVEGVTVRLLARKPGDSDEGFDPATAPTRRVLGRATTNTKGEFGFRGVVAEEVLVVADRSPGLAHAVAKPRLSRPDGPVNVVVRCPWRAVLRVTDEAGAPVARARVDVFDAPATAVPRRPAGGSETGRYMVFSDARGELDFTGISPVEDAWRVVVTPADVPPVSRPRELRGFRFTDATIVLPRAYAVRGVVRDSGVVRRPAGRPLQEIAAWWRAESGSWTPIRVADDGSFALEGLAPGTVRLRAHPKDLRAFDEAARETVVAAGTDGLVLEADVGETFEVRVADLEPWPVATSVRGQAWWKLHGTEASPATVSYRELDGEGVASIRGVRPGDALDVYIPQAGTGERCVYEVGLPGARRRVDVHTRPLVSLDGRLEGARTDQRHARLSASADGWDFSPARQGEAIRGGVPPVATLRVAFEGRSVQGGVTEVVEGHANVDPRRPFTVRVEVVPKR